MLSSDVETTVDSELSELRVLIDQAKLVLQMGSLVVGDNIFIELLEMLDAVFDQSRDFDFPKKLLSRLRNTISSIFELVTLVT